MTRDRKNYHPGLRALTVLAVSFLLVGGSLADDGTKTKDVSKSKKATPKSEKFPPGVIVRTDENEDVDGRTRNPEASRKPKGPPTLSPQIIDELIHRGLAETKTPVSEPTSDEEFIRRLYLDLLGKIPNPGSIREFVGSRMKDKRAKLIDNLLGQPEFSENWARYWRDVISYRSPNEADRNVNYPAFEKWLTGEFAANKPWDKIATEIITATGRTDENGATAFAVAEESSPVEMAGEVSRVFLGVQIQCAQCHDHPSDPWKRQQFHEFAAFFVGMKSKNVAEKGKPPVIEVTTNGPSHYSMPDLKNPEKKISVSPRFFLNDAPKVSEQVKADARLKLVAQYITDPENPWFARSFVNRVWYCLMGEGFYNPVDDLGPTRTPTSPELMELVCSNWEASGYDIRWLFRQILNTESYQRASRSTNTASGRTPFASNVPSRLRADQIFDSLTHALDLQHERDQIAAPAAKGPATKEMMAAERPKGPGSRDQFNKVFGVDPSTPNDDIMGTIPQALYMMNGPLVSKEVQARPKTMLGFLLTTHPDNRSVLEILYLRVLGRRPTDREARTCTKHLLRMGNRAEAFEDILWALLNSTEFLSRR